MSETARPKPPPDRREIARDLFRDHLDLTRMARAMAMARAERESEAARQPRAPAGGRPPGLRGA